ncbi:epimerase [Sphingobium sp. SCG-1]|uniref:NAD-dependent epimerase/dehydratase family protein n=1 Tax=Sphingobium sp. SCG-1 TaxID=2072936 RepID=UPI000CD6AF2C|nr:NAD-dependent epimerase/dehydratase family protein [Sphingobium sp. SCG-1]AUW57172.1 epimerase [Sphingobium sp. SCG-1]
MSKTVLVTGGTGSVGSWTIVELLKRGYSVRTTVRSLDKEAGLRERIAVEVDPADRLSFFAADLTSDVGWEAAVNGCNYVLHIAAPVGVQAPRNPDDLIIPTRDGALRVIRAACTAKVERVVLTSAVEACRPLMNSPDGIFDETVWTDVSDPDLGPYRIAKTLAERAVWAFMANQSGPTTLSTVLPVAVAGPTLNPDNHHSTALVERMLNGSLPRFPRIGFGIVDVRDVADLHIRAMTVPEAAGERFIAASEFVWLADVAKILRSELGETAKKVPTKQMPDFMLRIVALFQRPMRFVVPTIGRRHDFTSAKAQTILGWKPRPVAVTLVDSARSAIAVGAVRTRVTLIQERTT